MQNHLVQISLSIPDFEVRKGLWQDNLRDIPVLTNADVNELADRYILTAGQIRDTVESICNFAGFRKSSCITTADFSDVCRRMSAPKLGTLARKVESPFKFNDIILPKEQKKQLREIIGYLNYRHIVFGKWCFERKLASGKGLNALFAGPSGTGKTMAAGIIAGELDLDLYKIDLSTVVSKYIGETEKNLKSIFDEAENSNVVLFFDEADSLFGRRSEVRDAHDRYANIEISYLLQKMEEYEGIAILATNLRKNMDEAFVRRIHC